MKQGTLITRIIILVLFLGIAAYFGVYVWSSLTSGITTTTAYSYTAERKVTSTGWFFRDEAVLEDASELAEVLRTDGEAVAVGDTVARIYSSDEGYAVQKQLDEAQSNLSSLKYILSRTSESADTIALDDDIADAFAALHYSVASGDLSDLGTNADELRGLIFRRDYTYNGTDSLQAQIDEAVKAGTTVTADTLEELIAQTDIVDADAALAAIARYNELAAAGEDTDYYKAANCLYALENPPYYACKFNNAGPLLVSSSGIMTDKYGRVVDDNEQVIEGLYAAGNNQGGRFSSGYPTTVPGISRSFALVYGRIEGMIAAHDGDVSIIDNTVVETYEMKNQPTEWTAEDAANQPAEESPMGMPGEEAPATDVAAIADGIYEGSAKGIGGDVPVTVTVEGGKITAVEVGENSETQGIGSKAIEQLPAAIVEANGTDGVAAVSGATVTSKAIFEAVNEALASA